MGRLEFREIQCKTLLHALEFRSKSGYTANLYKGCSHGCIYCYAPSLIHDGRMWGSYVDVKVNAPAVLSRELRNLPKDVVFLSSASDPYQPLEARFRLTRRCLEVLLSYGFPVSILTRSPLVLRDIDILKKFEWVTVGFSISTVPERFYEPGVVPVERRIEFIRKLSDEGIKCWVSLAPIIPGLVLVDLNELMSRLRRAGASAVAPAMLRFSGYDASRSLFEQVTGGSVEPLVEGQNDLLSNVRRLISEYGLEKSEALFDWRVSERRGSLDNFMASELL